MPVFLSHSQSDQAVYSTLCVALDGQRIPRWDVATMHPGQPLADQLRFGIQECEACVFLATQKSLESRWCRAELGAFWGAGKDVLIYVIDAEIDQGDLPPQFQQNLWTRNAAQLIEALVHVVPRRDDSEQPTPVLSETDRFNHARMRVLDYLIWKQYNKASFIALRKNIDADFTDEFLTQLITRFPDDFRKSTYRSKPAIARRVG